MTDILNREMQKYIKDGWLIQSQTDMRIQLYRKAQKSKLGCLLLGIPYLLWPKRDEVVTLEIGDNGKLKTIRTKVKG